MKNKAYGPRPGELYEAYKLAPRGGYPVVFEQVADKESQMPSPFLKPYGATKPNFSIAVNEEKGLE